MPLGDLVTNFSANTQGLDKGIAKSKSGLSGFAASAKSSLNIVKVGFAAVGGAAIAAGAAIWGFSGRLDALDKVAKDAQRTGLSGKFLQQLQFAADQSGVSAEQLTGGVKRLTRTIGDAQSGNKAAADAFSEIGISMAELAAMSPDDQFRKVAEKLSQIPTAAGRAAAAVKIFGKSGAELNTLFAGGAKGIDELLAKAEKLKIGIDAEGLQKIQDANDAIGAMKAAFTSLMDQVTVGLAPVFKDIADSITAWIPPITEFVDQFNHLPEKWEWLGDTFVAAFDVAIESIKEHWRVMLDEMVQAASDTVLSVNWGVGGEVGAGVARKLEMDLPGGLEDAKERLNAQMAMLAPKAEWQGPIKQEQKKATGDFAGLFGQIADAAALPIKGLKQVAMQKFEGAKNTLGFIGDLAKTAFGGETATAEKAKALEPRLAGASVKGSAEAYSTIVQSMLRGGKDPVVTATEKQTKDLIKGLKPLPPAFNFVAAFLP